MKRESKFSTSFCIMTNTHFTHSFILNRPVCKSSQSHSLNAWEYFHIYIKVMITFDRALHENTEWNQITQERLKPIATRFNHHVLFSFLHFFFFFFWNTILWSGSWRRAAFTETERKRARVCCERQWWLRWWKRLPVKWCECRFSPRFCYDEKSTSMWESPPVSTTLVRKIRTLPLPLSRGYMCERACSLLLCVAWVVVNIYTWKKKKST